ncbi:MAG: MinD/ParA family protein [Halodesulfurarchaeum sp.]
MSDGIIYAVASGKGGVGKTTTSVNVGAGFATAGHSVVVVDLDLGMANLGDFVDASPRGPTLHDVLAGEATLDDAISHASEGLDVVLGSEDITDFGKADPTNVRSVLSDLTERYDFVILDSGGGLSHDTALPLGLADAVILVSTVEDPSLKNTRKTLELAEKISGTVEGIVFTRIGGGKEADPTTVAERVGVRLIGTVPEDRTVVESAKAGTPLLTYDPESPAAQSYLEIAYDLLDEPLPMQLGTESGSTGNVSTGGPESPADLMPDDSTSTAADGQESTSASPSATSSTPTAETTAADSDTDSQTASADGSKSEDDNSPPSLLARLTGGLFG